MNTSVNELLSNPAFRPLVLLDVHDQSPVMRGEHCVETYRLSVCLGDVRFEPDLKLVLDTGFLDSLMAKDDSHRNRMLLDVSADVLD